MESLVKLITAGIAFPALLIVSACGGEAEKTHAAQGAREASELFVDAYYINDDLKAAVALTSGNARKRVAGELKDVEASGVTEPTTGKPNVKKKLTDSERISDTEGLIVWRLEPSDSTPMSVEMTISKMGDDWLVAEIWESQITN